MLHLFEEAKCKANPDILLPILSGPQAFLMEKRLQYIFNLKMSELQRGNTMNWAWNVRRGWSLISSSRWDWLAKYWFKMSVFVSFNGFRKKERFVFVIVFKHGTCCWFYGPINCASNPQRFSWFCVDAHFSFTRVTYIHIYEPIKPL